MSVTYFLSENSVKASRIICYYLWIQHQNPSTHSGIRHYDAFQDTWDFPKSNILESKHSKKKKWKKCVWIVLMKTIPLAIKYREWAVSQKPTQICTTKLVDEVEFWVFRMGEIMQGVPLSHNISFTCLLLAVKHIIDLRDLKKDYVTILKIWEVRMKILTIPSR